MAWHVQCDFCEYAGQDYMLIADEISGFSKVTKTKNKSTKEAIRVLRQWGATFGLPYRAKTDFGPAYRDEFKAECKALRVEVIHSSCYNAPSQGWIEQKVAIFKELLKSPYPHYPSCRLTSSFMKLILERNRTRVLL